MIPEQYAFLIDPCTQLIQRITHESNITVTHITEWIQPTQGFSGGEVRLYDVSYHVKSESQTTQIVSKNAVPLEQHIVSLFAAQNQAIPPAIVPEHITDQRQPIYMQYAHMRPPDDIISDPYAGTAQQVAQGLARIHAANRTHCPEWLPRASDDFMRRLYLYSTQQVWERCLSDNRFYAEFGQYDTQVRAGLQRFLTLLEDLTAEGDTLTLINTDLHPDHIRLLENGQPVFIDWEQACYGPFYLDLVNYFSLETALLYRDALAEAGYAIPPAVFMERFREAGLYMGLRYLEVGLLAWLEGGQSWKGQRWFFHYCLTMAMNGR